MSKYRPLLDHLASARTERQRLSFAAIEQILGFALPASARTYQAWWANDASNGRQSGAWLSAGWKTDELDLAGEKVTFQRSEPGQPAKPRTPARASFNEDDLEDVPGGGVRLSIDMRWRRLGAVIVGEGGALIFPAAPAEPALYRLRLTGATAERHYIGESVNLRRRFGNYRRPGPAQQTSIRINELLHSHLAAGGSIEADIILSGTALHCDGAPRTVDLSDKQTRRLLEQAALVGAGGIDIESLNR